MKLFLTRPYRNSDGKLNTKSHLGFSLNTNKWISLPDYYDPELRQEIDDLNNTDKFEVKTINTLKIRYYK